MAKRCGTSTVTQTIVFPKSYGVAKARAWLKRHGERSSKVDIKPTELRFRQISPKACRRGQFATIPMGRTGIRRVICCPR